MSEYRWTPGNEPVSDHDPLCRRNVGSTHACLDCILIRLTEARERAAIMARVKQDMSVDREKWAVMARSVSTEQVRADERERIAQAVKRLPHIQWFGAACVSLGHVLALLTREGGRDV